MELCTARGISNLPPFHLKHFAPSHSQFRSLFRWNTYFPFLHKQTRFSSGLQYFRNSSVRSTSDETSTDTTYTTSFFEDDRRRDSVVIVEDTQTVEKKEDYDFQLNEAPEERSEPDGVITVEDAQLVENKEDYDSQLNEVPQEGSLTDNPLQLFKFLEDLNIKLEYEETYSIIVFGGGGAVSLWLVAAVIGAIDSIPVFPKVLELIGLGYTLWFSSRYLIFKKNRDVLLARVEQIKQEVLGSNDD